MSFDDQSPQAIATRFVNARLNHEGLTEFPGSIPDDMATCYQIQDHAIQMWQDDIVGWKVGGVPPAFQDKYVAKRLAGPIFKTLVKHSDNGAHTVMPVFEKGYAAIEAEFVLELGDVSALPSSDLSVEHVLSAVKRVFIGVEIASSPLTIINDIGPAGPASDFGNNYGLIVGPELKNWQNKELSEYDVTVNISGKHMGTVPCQPGLNGPLGAVKFLIEHLKQHDYDIPVGTYVSTGAITGVHQAYVGDSSEIIFEGIGDLTLSLEASN